MAADEQMEILAELLAKALGRESAVEGLAKALEEQWAQGAERLEVLSGAAEQLDRLRQASQQQVSATEESAEGRVRGAQGRLDPSGALRPASILSGIFGSGFGLSPLISGILSLFSGPRKTAEAAPAEYEKPGPVRFSGGYSRATDDRIYAVDYAAGDRLRLLREAGETAAGTARPGEEAGLNGVTGIPSQAEALEQLRRATIAADWEAHGQEGVASAPGGELGSNGGRGGLYGAPTQVTVQVQAMDSRSFLDHSEEIARAVRQAMLNSHGINDVVTEL